MDSSKAKIAPKSLTLHIFMSKPLNKECLMLKGVCNCILAAVMFNHMWRAVVRPLTAEEITLRREALKQRLVEKKEHNSQDSVSAAGELSNGNVN